MHIPFTHGPGTVGREDRLVRGCIALSLLLLAGFSVVMSGRSGVISIAFLLLGLYFTLTAALGRDPFYARFGIDTRTDAQPAAAPQESGDVGARQTTGWTCGTRSPPGATTTRATPCSAADASPGAGRPANAVGSRSPRLASRHCAGSSESLARLGWTRLGSPGIFG